jgi:transposase-like protein
MSRHNKTGPDAIERERRRADALELREKGYSYRAIAQELGVSLDTAHQDVKTAMAAITKEPAETVLALELARLDEYERRLREAIEGGDLDRIDSALRVQARRAKLLGLDHKAILDLNRSTGNLSDVDLWLAHQLGKHVAETNKVDLDTVTSVEDFEAKLNGDD